ncbi:patatin-like phospholipase family protein [Vibrio astriarenae]
MHKPNVLRQIMAISLATNLIGCGSIPHVTNSTDTITNDTVSNKSLEAPYSITLKTDDAQDSDVLILVSFSGGGTRAAALSYGVMKGMRELEYYSDGQQYALIEQLDVISSVSGGSFTSAYYGLYQDKLFDTYEEEFLYKDISRDLLSILTSPEYVLSSNSRSAAAANFYNENLFSRATFSEIKEDGPIVLINATDLGGGVRFSFVQEYFDLLCSDVNDYSIADAVAASSAVPFIFTPVLLENHSDCDVVFDSSQWSDSNTLSRSTISGLESYADKEQRPYVHLIDGGITDNLGLMALYDIFESNNATLQQKLAHINKVVIISVDASTKPNWGIDQSPKTPSARNMLGAVTDVQLHRYNDMSKLLIEERLKKWKSAADHRETYFIDVNLANASNTSFFYQIPTDFNLESEQVDALIEHGYQQILTSPQLHTAFEFTPTY